MKRGEVVWACYDGKLGRAKPGIVLATSQNSAVKVRFDVYHSTPAKTVDVWFRRKSYATKSVLYGDGKPRIQQPVRYCGPRYMFSAWVREDEMMELFYGGNNGSYYSLVTTNHMMRTGYNPLDHEPAVVERVKQLQQEFALIA